MYTPFSRNTNKALGAGLMVLGFFLSTPPGMIAPDDFLNIGLAGLLVKYFGIDKITALILTYSVIAWGLILLGAMIYPYSTKRLLSGKFHMFQRYVKKLYKDPLLLGLTVLMFFILFNIYSKILGV